MIDSDTRVIAASRGKTALMCLGSIAFVAIGGWLVKEHSSEKAMIAGWAALGFFSLAGVMWTLQLVWPSRLILDGDGLAFHYLFATFRRRWVDVRQIDVVQIKSTRIVKLVAKPGGKDLDLGGAWPMSADELVSLIEGYLVRLGRADAA
jgi:hypothetical protein